MTILDALKELPDGDYKNLAIERATEQGGADDSNDFTMGDDSVIWYAFTWEATEEGHEFWYDVARFFDGQTLELPPIPMKEGLV